MTGSTGMSKLLDTWAWMEFYEGGDIGENIYSLIKSDEELYTSKITLAELSDNFHRGNLKTDHPWEQILGFVETHSNLLDLDSKTVSEAGKIKTREGRQKKDFGLVDGIILATAELKNLELISGDPHLADKKVSVDLR